MKLRNMKKLNVAIYGDSLVGKSTLKGRLVFDCGDIDERTREKLSRSDDDIQFFKEQSTNKYAYFLNRMIERPGRVIPKNRFVPSWKFITSIYDATIDQSERVEDIVIDSIKGGELDVLILMIDASSTSFENIFRSVNSRKDSLGYISELFFTMGVRNVLVCVNKMDHENVKYSEDIFNRIRSSLSESLGKIGFSEDVLTFLPISTLEGDNINSKSQNMSQWWSKDDKGDENTRSSRGMTLLEILDHRIISVEDLSNGPLRVNVQAVYKIGGIGTVPVGKVESGRLKKGMDIIFIPPGISAKVKNMEMYHEQVEMVKAGDNFGFTVTNRSITRKTISRGCTVGEYISDDDVDKDRSNYHPPREAEFFEARIHVFDRNKRSTLRKREEKMLSVGEAVTVTGRSVNKVSCRIVFITRILDDEKQSTMSGGEYCRFIGGGETAIVMFQPLKPVVIETYEDFQALGRLYVMNSDSVKNNEDDSQIITGFGRVTRVKHKNYVPENIDVFEKERSEYVLDKLLEDCDEGILGLVVKKKRIIFFSGESITFFKSLFFSQKNL